MKLKTRIVLHGNEDSQNSEMKFECAMCSSDEISFVLLFAALYSWHVTKADVESAFIQTVSAEHGNDVRPNRESQDRRHYWLLFSAAYGLVKASPKFQHQSDGLKVGIGLAQLAYIPQLSFYQLLEYNVVLLVAKIVNDLLTTEEGRGERGGASVVSFFPTIFDHKFKHGTFSSGSGVLSFHERMIEQKDDYLVTVHANEKFLA